MHDREIRHTLGLFKTFEGLYVTFGTILGFWNFLGLFETFGDFWGRFETFEDVNKDCHV